MLISSKSLLTPMMHLPIWTCLCTRSLPFNCCAALPFCLSPCSMLMILLSSSYACLGSSSCRAFRPSGRRPEGVVPASRLGIARAFTCTLVMPPDPAAGAELFRSVSLTC